MAGWLWIATNVSQTADECEQFLGLCLLKAKVWQAKPRRAGAAVSSAVYRGLSRHAAWHSGIICRHRSSLHRFGLAVILLIVFVIRRIWVDDQSDGPMPGDVGMLLQLVFDPGLKIVGHFDPRFRFVFKLFF
jgi:hypothetical protein